MQDSPISKVIRKMARTACGLPANPEKKGFFLFRKSFWSSSKPVRETAEAAEG